MIKIKIKVCCEVCKKESDEVEASINLVNRGGHSGVPYFVGPEKLVPLWTVVEGIDRHKFYCEVCSSVKQTKKQKKEISL